MVIAWGRCLSKFVPIRLQVLTKRPRAGFHDFGGMGRSVTDIIHALVAFGEVSRHTVL